MIDRLGAGIYPPRPTPAMKPKREKGMSKEGFAMFFMLLTEKSFLKQAKELEKLRGKIPDDILTNLHVRNILYREEQIKELVA